MLLYSVKDLKVSTLDVSTPECFSFIKYSLKNTEFEYL